MVKRKSKKRKYPLSKRKSSMKIERFSSTNVLELISDALSFAYLSYNICDTCNHRNSNRFARASIIHSALALEAISNQGLRHCRLVSENSEGFDRLGILEKFELLALKLSFGDQDFDRKEKRVKAIIGLISLRNFYAHPKDRIKQKSRTFPSLNIPKDISAWKTNHAYLVLKTLADFVDYFFKELCEIKERDIAEILLDKYLHNGFKAKIGDEYHLQREKEPFEFAKDL